MPDERSNRIKASRARALLALTVLSRHHAQPVFVVLDDALVRWSAPLGLMFSPKRTHGRVFTAQRSHHRPARNSGMPSVELAAQA